MAANLVKTGKFLSLVLRHKPETIGLILDANGWANVNELIRLANRHGNPLTRPLLERVVAENDKQRFAFSDDGQRIRANQGHSVEIDLDLPASAPPELLYHGTATGFVASIRAAGLHAGNRRHVHLSLDVATATKVGRRHGHPVVLVVRAGQMAAAGHKFFRAANGVWLTDRVPVEYIGFPSK
jgi:putative RNA 2'-phosphotransferase